jgi:dienelactone hydrolase
MQEFKMIKFKNLIFFALFHVSFAAYAQYKTEELSITFVANTRWGSMGEANMGSSVEHKVIIKKPISDDPNQKFPLIVHVNNSGGSNDHTMSYSADFFPKIGVAVALLDLYKGRNLKSAISNQKVIFTGTTAEETMQFLNVARKLSYVKENSIGVMGHSRGSQIATHFTPFKSFLKFTNASDVFDFHIGLGNGCQQIYEDLETTGKPILRFQAERDTQWFNAKCDEYISNVKARNPNVEYVIVPNAYHNLGVFAKYDPGIYTARRCKNFLLINQDGNYKYEGRIRARNDMFEQCKEMGSYADSGPYEMMGFAYEKIIQWLKMIKII